MQPVQELPSRRGPRRPRRFLEVVAAVRAVQMLDDLTLFLGRPCAHHRGGAVWALGLTRLRSYAHTIPLMPPDPSGGGVPTLIPEHLVRVYGDRAVPA